MLTGEDLGLGGGPLLWHSLSGGCFSEVRGVLTETSAGCRDGSGGGLLVTSGVSTWGLAGSWGTGEFTNGGRDGKGGTCTVLDGGGILGDGSIGWAEMTVISGLPLDLLIAQYVRTL